ncbi:hypothetical protein LCGC14_2437400, partial [marine sediment metagenome]
SEEDYSIEYDRKCNYNKAQRDMIDAGWKKEKR